MNKDIIDPFNCDVEARGAYEYTSPQRFSSRCANQRVSDKIVKIIPAAGKRIIDVGCGDGTYTALLRAETQARFVLGIDPAEKAIQRAKDHYAGKYQNLDFQCWFAKYLVRRGEHFDIAVYRGVVHHVSDPQAEIATALELADLIFFDEPNGWNFVVKILERVSTYHRSHGERSFRLGQFSRWIRQGGGKVEHCAYYGLVPFFCPDWLASICSFFESLVERIPLVRILCCGHFGILASCTCEKKEE